MTELQDPLRDAAVASRASTRLRDVAQDSSVTSRVGGTHAFPADLYAEGMLWAAVARSPHASAVIREIDTGPATRLDGVRAVITAEDLPQTARAGERPVLASGVVRYRGEPIALVAADHPAIAARAASDIAVRYEELAALHDPLQALTAPPIHVAGNIYGHELLRLGDLAAAAGAPGVVTVEQQYRIGAAEAVAFGAEAVLAVPLERGVEVHAATRFPSRDRARLAAIVGLDPHEVRVVPAGISGVDAPTADLGLQVQACLLAIRAGRPVKLLVDGPDIAAVRARRPATHIHCRHYADPAGALLGAEITIVVDGGAYRAGAAMAMAEACRLAIGPYRMPNLRIEGWAVRTNNPPAGRPRGGGGVLACAAAEGQLDALARKLGIGGIDLRLRNLLTEGDLLPTGSPVSAVPAAEVIKACLDAPLPSFPPGPDVRDFPGTIGRTGELTRLRRGVGMTLAMVDLTRYRAVEEFTTARVELVLDDTGVAATVCCPLVDAGGGAYSLLGELTRRLLGVDRVAVRLVVDDPTLPTSGAVSRPSALYAGAVERAARQLRAMIFRPLADQLGITPDLLDVRDGQVISFDGVLRHPLHDVLVSVLRAGQPLAATAEYRIGATGPREGGEPAAPPGEIAIAALRAVVDVDTELGTSRVVELAVAQDVGRVVCRDALVSRIENGAVIGVGIAMTEEAPPEPVRDPTLVSALPTTLDQPTVRIAALVESAEIADQNSSRPDTGARGERVSASGVPGSHGRTGAPAASTSLTAGMKPVGDLPVVGAPAAVIAAIADAVGAYPVRLPVRPADLPVVR